MFYICDKVALAVRLADINIREYFTLQQIDTQAIRRKFPLRFDKAIFVAYQLKNGIESTVLKKDVEHFGTHIHIRSDANTR